MTDEYLAMRWVGGDWNIDEPVPPAPEDDEDDADEADPEPPMTEFDEWERRLEREGFDI